MSRFSAPSKIEQSEIVSVQTVYGDTCYLYRPQLEEPRNIYLKMYRKSGLSVEAHNERMHFSPTCTGAFLHRENIAVDANPVTTEASQMPYAVRNPPAR